MAAGCILTQKLGTKLENPAKIGQSALRHPATEMPLIRSRLLRYPAPLFGGAVLILAAVLVSNTRIEQAFGRIPHSLAWGPALFRGLLALHGLGLILASLLAKGPLAMAQRRSTRRGTYAILAALTLLAALLSVPSLNSCLWLDEVLTLVHYARPPMAWILTSYPDQNQHMLYSLLAHCSLRIFGEQAWALRLPAVVFGAGSIWALFLLGRRLVGETEALLACALATVSYHRIWFSQDARGYTGLLFFTLLATWLWLEALDRDQWRTWLGYSACVVLGIWIHMSMLFVAAAHALIFLIVWLRSERRLAPLSRAAAAFALCGTISLQIYALSLPEFLRTAVWTPHLSAATQWTHLWWTISESLRSLRLGSAAVVVVVFGAAFFAAGWFRIFRQQQPAAWAMILPAVLTGATMLALEHCLFPRFFFFSMGFGVLIFIHGAMLAARWSPRAGYWLVGLMIVASALTVPHCYALPKQDFVGARDYVERQRTGGDPVIAVSLAAHAYSEYYAPAWPAAWNSGELAALRGTSGRAFLVYTLPEDLRAFHPDLWSAVHADFDTVKIFPGTLGGGEVYVCRERKLSGK
jgi:mannosyltransferase